MKEVLIIYSIIRARTPRLSLTPFPGSIPLILLHCHARISPHVLFHRHSSLPVRVIFPKQIWSCYLQPLLLYLNLRVAPLPTGWTLCFLIWFIRTSRTYHSTGIIFYFTYFTVCFTHVAKFSHSLILDIISFHSISACAILSKSRTFTIPLNFEEAGPSAILLSSFFLEEVEPESRAKAFILCYTAEGPHRVPGGHSESLGLIMPPNLPQYKLPWTFGGDGRRNCIWVYLRSPNILLYGIGNSSNWGNIISCVRVLNNTRIDICESLL